MGLGIEIYTLTSIGRRLARSTNSPDKPSWRIIHYLDTVGHATKDQIAMRCAINEQQAGGVLGMLRRRGIVEEESSIKV